MENNKAGSLELKKGSFSTKIENGLFKRNEYDCVHCRDAGIEHTVRDVAHGHTNGDSPWGSGVPSTRRECSACLRWDGPWVSADLVGGWY